MSSLIRPTFDEYFLEIAEVVKIRSPDPKKQVGCVLVDSDEFSNRIISTGYNGLPKGINETDFDWNDRESIKKVIVHAEVNCVNNLYDDILYPEECDLVLYTTLSPCLECIKTLNEYGIKKIIYKEKYKRFDEVLKYAKLHDIELEEGPTKIIYSKSITNKSYFNK